MVATFEDGVYRCADDFVVKVSRHGKSVVIDHTGANGDPARFIRKHRKRLRIP